LVCIAASYCGIAEVAEVDRDRPGRAHVVAGLVTAVERTSAMVEIRSGLPMQRTQRRFLLAPSGARAEPVDPPSFVTVTVTAESNGNGTSTPACCGRRSGGRPRDSGDRHRVERARRNGARRVRARILHDQGELGGADVVEDGRHLDLLPRSPSS
jgi:hypothetical protein